MRHAVALGSADTPPHPEDELVRPPAATERRGEGASDHAPVVVELSD